MNLARVYEKTAEERPVNVRRLADEGWTHSLGQEIRITSAIRQLSQSVATRETRTIDRTNRHTDVRVDLFAEEHLMRRIFRKIADVLGDRVSLRQLNQALHGPLAHDELRALEADRAAGVVEQIKKQVAVRVSGTMAILAKIPKTDARHDPFVAHLHQHVLGVLG